MLKIEKKIEIKKPLCIAITHACNLSCEGCTHYSDYKHNWFISLEEFENWVGPWSKILNPSHLFVVYGGEPTLHKDLCEILIKTREYFPNSPLRLTTNAFFLHKHKNIFEILTKLNFRLMLSIHDKKIEYIEKVKKNIEEAKEWEKKGLKLEWAEMSSSNWEKKYFGYGKDMKPFNHKNPRASWEICKCKCFQIKDQYIWKCAPIAYLEMQYKKYKLSFEWDEYLNYKPLRVESTFKEKINFFKREEEFICGMCPSKPNFIKRTSPFNFGCDKELIELDINVKKHN